MKILVTGGKGFIGSKIVEMLSKDHKVTVVDNHDTYGIMTKEELNKLYNGVLEIGKLKTCQSLMEIY